MPVDMTHKASQMPPDSGILYRNPVPSGNDPSAYVGAFCNSCGLIRPEEGADVELTSADCLGRYLYVTIINDEGDVDSDPCPRVSRFLTREAALIKRPEVAKVALREQAPLRLKVLSS